MSSNSEEIAQIILRRYPCLSVLAKNPQTKPSIVDELDVPRSTLDGIMRDLHDADLVVYRDGKWHITIFGQCALQIHKKYISQLDSLTKIAPLGNTFAPDSPITSEFLIDADVYETNPSMPDAIMQKVLDSVELATEVHIITPVVMTGFADTFYDCVRTGEEYSLDIVIQSEIFERVHTTCPNLTEELMCDSNVHLYGASIPFNFGLWIVDSEEAGIIVFTKQGVSSILVNDTDNALEWATNHYERVKQDSDQIFHQKEF